MNKKAQTHYHAHYTGDIPFGIWVLIVSIACIALGIIIPDFSFLLFIGIVLLVLWIGAAIILIAQEFNR
jgi:hypothetical protein